MSPFKLAGVSVQSTTGRLGVRIRGSNAGYTMFRGSVKGTGYPFHSPVSPSLPLPCVMVCHRVSTGLYKCLVHFTECPEYKRTNEWWLVNRKALGEWRRDWRLYHSTIYLKWLTSNIQNLCGFIGTSLMQTVYCYFITLFFTLHVSDVIHIHPQERHIMYMQMVQVSAL